MFGHKDHKEETHQVAAVDPRKERISIVLFSGTADKLLAASVLASGAALMGIEVDLFLTTWGLMAFRKGDFKTNTRVSADFADYGPVFVEKLSAPNSPNWMNNLVQAKELGDVHVIACGLTMEMFGMSKEHLEDIVDDIAGVAGFLERAKDSKITLFI